MYHKCEISFIYKPKDLFANEKSLYSALREFFLSKGYSMNDVESEDDDKMFTIEPLPEIMKQKKVVIPTKTK